VGLEGIRFYLRMLIRDLDIPSEHALKLILDVID